MAYSSYEQVAATAVVKTGADLSFLGNDAKAEVQADTNDIRYTMDGTTNPTQTSGMVLLTTEPPKLFLKEDLLNIRFVRGADTNGNLNIHYLTGRIL